MPQMKQLVRRHPWRAAGALGAVVLAVAAFMGRDLIGLLLTPDEPVAYTLPSAAPLSPAPGETVYRIDAERSLVTVRVQERLAGVTNEVELTTRGITGDVGVPSGDLAAARVGEVAVAVGQLQSDNALRDKVIRQDPLNSREYPVVRLTGGRVTGLSPGMRPGSSVDFRITGELVVKGRARPVTFASTARIDGDELTATARARLKMSDLGVGPITKVGLVSTSNDLAITLRIVAVDGRRFQPAAQLRRATTDQVRATSGSSPSFAKQVRPLLSASCAACHAPGTPGAARWTLRTAGDAADVADGLAVVTGSRYMPPWPASDKGVPLQNSRALSVADITLLRDWAAAGAPLDVPRSTTVTPPAEPEVAVPRADATLALSEPYQGGPSTPDDYRCFVLDPKVATPTFMTGYVFTPELKNVVHHALVYRVRARGRASADARDAADPGSGFNCVGMAGSAGARSDLVAGWVPGQRPAKFKAGDAYDLQPGDFLVAQIHYHYDATSPTDRSSISLETTTDPTGITTLVTRELQAPVELPCPAGSTAPLCDRGAAVADAAARFGPIGGIIPDALHALCGTTPEQVAAASDGRRANTSCDYRIWRPGKIVDVLGHMHNLGASYRMTLNPGTPEEKVLLDIPVWNFAWQLNYQPVEEIQVKAGDVIRTECSWDRNLRFDPEPRYILFAEGTNDEMCFSTYTMRPDPTP